jgi:hypothetical protein
MSYEFNPESGKLDFPNPFVVENKFLFTSAFCQCAGSLVLLLVCRRHVELQNWHAGTLPIIAGIGLLVSGLNQARRAMIQLRFFFGRSKPVSLAPDLAPGIEGTTQAAEFLKKTLRQNAIDYPEPTGPLNGLLYSWLPSLIYAPIPIQRIAQRQFHNALAILATLLSFMISWVGFSSIASSAWMGLFYFTFSLFLLLRPLESGPATKADVGLRALVILVLCSIFGPALVPALTQGLPNIGWLSLNGQTLFLLSASLTSVALFFRALICQMNNPPKTNPAFEQISLSMNCHPNQLIGELDRKLQQAWTEQIPNRRYTKVSPIVTGDTGSFHAQVLEETQPMPAGDLNRNDLSAAFTLPRFVWIAWLDSLGLTLTIVAVISLVLYGWGAEPVFGSGSMIGYLTFGLATLTLGGFCLRVGHSLWGRFDFRSELIWVSMDGNYQAAKMEFGNQYTDRIKTNKQIINIETMTLRVWVAEIETVIFDKNSARSLIALHGLPDKASELASHLAHFAGEQSMIITPTAQVDLQKAVLIGALNAPGDGVDTSLQRSLMKAVVEAQARTKTVPISANPEDLKCPACKAHVASDSTFCSKCGTKLMLLSE